MSQRHTKPPIDFSDFMAKAEIKNSWPIKLGDKTFRVKSPRLLSQKQKAEMEAADNEDDVARMMIDDFDGFAAAGGSATMLGLFVESMVAGGVEDDSPGE